jgi:hypothetical protein
LTTVIDLGVKVGIDLEGEQPTQEAEIGARFRRSEVRTAERLVNLPHRSLH